MNDISGDLPFCPQCGYVIFYFLADGRLQCRRCRYKFTPSRKESRLRKETILEILHFFWLLTPAQVTAGKLGINRKTVQRLYHVIRQRIAKESERALNSLNGEVTLHGFFVGKVSKEGSNGEAWGTFPIFGMMFLQDQIRLLPQLNPVDYRRLRLDSLQYVSVNEKEKTDHDGGEFWDFARRRLKRYRGGYRTNFPLFMREMEFRYNCRHRPDMEKYLFKLLLSGPFWRTRVS
ncbi:MAG: hypothetical protein PVG03_06345 [Desulfarculaceae bacterium]|jgi:transposase